MRRCLVVLPLLVLCAVAASAQPPGVAEAPPVPYELEPLAFDVLQFHVEGDLLLPPGAEHAPVIVYVWGAGPTNRQATIAKSPVLRSMLKAGYAVYLHDKPGSGGSTGEFTPGLVFHERARLTAAALDTLARHQRLDPTRMGLIGSSQAAYVMPLVLQAADSVAFMICWSCPMEDSIEQSAYLVGNLVRCAGRDDATAAEARRRYRARALAPDYAAYRQAAAWLDSLPEIRDDLGWGGVADENDFAPLDEDSEMFLDPGAEFPPLEMPVLVIYGRNDRNIDPVQGEKRFRELLGRGDAGLQEIRIIDGADHNMRLTPDGCVQHQLRGYKDLPSAPVADEFSAVISDWLKRLKKEKRLPR